MSFPIGMQQICLKNEYLFAFKQSRKELKAKADKRKNEVIPFAKWKHHLILPYLYIYLKCFWIIAHNNI